jgi:hypothetical protein
MVKEKRDWARQSRPYGAYPLTRMASGYAVETAS